MADFKADERRVSELANEIGNNVKILESLVNDLQGKNSLLRGAINDDAYSDIAAVIQYVQNQVSQAQSEVSVIQKSLNSYAERIRRSTYELKNV